LLAAAENEIESIKIACIQEDIAQMISSTEHFFANLPELQRLVSEQLDAVHHLFRKKKQMVNSQSQKDIVSMARNGLIMETLSYLTNP